MRINGYWRDTEAGVALPTVAVYLQAADGTWRRFSFLLDTGAERTLLRYQEWFDLGVEGEPGDAFFQDRRRRRR